ncbi:MAG: hypothetical protein M3Y86_01560 [Verrucomicrobiota bacterium]|nr:hypothetical protein [Verrucomicrobiota bacterium]
MEALDTYLNDHLAGAVGAVDMLEAMIDAHEDKPLAPFLRALKADIESDQGELQQLMTRLGIGESTIKKAGAWVAEKFSRAKLRLGDSGEPNLALLQALESLSLGITGKRSLWRSLGAAASAAPRLAGFDFARLEQRALEQFERVEAKAQEIAAQIFPPDLNQA